METTTIDNIEKKEEPVYDVWQNRTTLTLSKKTRQRLEQKGKKGESYDTLINRIITTLEQNKLD